MLTLYIQHLLALGRSKGTIRLHLNYLRLIRTCAPAPRRVTPQALEHALAQRQWSPETRKSARGVARGFFKWAFEAGYLDTNPAARLDAVTVPSRAARPATDKTIEKALHLAESERVRLMIEFAAYAGLRCCEIAQIHGRDWDGEYLAVVGKGRKLRLVPILRPRLRMALNGAEGYLFPGQEYGHLSAAYVSKLIGRNLPEGVTAHMLRHRFATAAYEGTQDLLAVSALLGHTKPETTRQYVQLPRKFLVAAVAAAG